MSENGHEDDRYGWTETLTEKLLDLHDGSPSAYRAALRAARDQINDRIGDSLSHEAAERMTGREIPYVPVPAEETPELVFRLRPRLPQT